MYFVKIDFINGEVFHTNAKAVKVIKEGERTKRCEQKFEKVTQS